MVVFHRYTHIVCYCILSYKGFFRDCHCSMEENEELRFRRRKFIENNKVMQRFACFCLMNTHT